MEKLHYGVHIMQKEFYFDSTYINNDNRTEWSPIRSVTIQMTLKLDNCEVGVRFVKHEYDYGLDWMT